MVGAYAVLPSLAGADSPPTLPPISAQDLVAKVHQASVPGLSGDITSTPHLGLPDLSAVLDQSGRSDFALKLLTANQTLKVWQAGNDVRLALPSSLAESDLVRRGQDVWVWQSDGQRVSHLSLEPDTGKPDTGKPEAGTPDAGKPGAGTEPTPQGLAQHFLSSVDPTTRVFVRDTVSIAGQDAYELVLAPKSDTTLVADVVIAVDAGNGLPLRVQVLSRDSGTPAIDVGFSSIDFSVPSASTFAFTPPPGSQVTEAHSAEDLLMPAGGDRGGPKAGEGDTAQPAQPGQPGAPASGSRPEPQVVGEGWDSIVLVDVGSDPATTSGLNMFEKLGTPVQGSWGSGRFLHTTLFNVLLTDKHTLVVGSVPEAALEAAAAGH